jgi:hypothetical protein
VEKDLDFRQFVRAVEELDITDKNVKATAHTSAVSIRWDPVADRAEQPEQAREAIEG